MFKRKLMFARPEVREDSFMLFLEGGPRNHHGYRRGTGNASISEVIPPGKVTFSHPCYVIDAGLILAIL